MKTLRSTFLAGIAVSGAAATAIRYPAGAAEFTYKVANDIPAEHPVCAHILKVAARLKQESGGQLELHVFPNSQLGGQSSMLTQTRQGAIEMLQIADNVMADVVPLASLSGVPFTLTNYKEVWSAMDGSAGAAIVSAIVAAKTGVTPLGKMWDAGFRQMINSSRPITVPADLKGLKMRVPQAVMPVAMFKAFGVSPTPISAAEMYTGLQTHLVDGAEMPLVSVEAFKLYEVQKYASITNHNWTGYRLYTNNDAWQKLPQKLRDMVLKEYDAETPAERDEVAKGDSVMAAQLKGQGMLFNTANAAAFKSTLAAGGLYKQWRDNFGVDAWAQLEKAVGKLT